MSVGVSVVRHPVGRRCNGRRLSMLYRIVLSLPAVICASTYQPNPEMLPPFATVVLLTCRQIFNRRFGSNYESTTFTSKLGVGRLEAVPRP